MNEPRAAAFACLLLLLPGISHSVTTFESPPQAIPLIELFTSEGCNSCPPADAWLSSLKGSAVLWTQYVPVTFHVTYWDGLGWRDRFAQQQFDALQAVRASHAGTSVYTPGVFVAGKEWRAWRRSPHAHEQLSGSAVGVLKLAMAGTTADITFASAHLIAPPKVVLAWLQANESTQVRRGENAGKTLRHEFVVTRLQAAQMQDRDGTWHAALATTAADTTTHQAAAVWVVDADEQPIQATGGWLSRTDAAQGRTD